MDKQTNCPDNDILAMAFVNIQPDDGLYDVSAGFERGTIFPDLDKPFLRGGDEK